MASHKTKHFHKKENPKSAPSTLDYLNHKRMNPTDAHPVLSPAVDPFSKDDVDETVDQTDVVNRRKETVPVNNRNFRYER